MNSLVSYLPADFGLPQFIAAALIFGLWGFYTHILRVIGQGTLNSQLHIVRLRWVQMHQAIKRESRVFDAVLLGHISGSISYFGSATLIVLAGLVGTLVNVKTIYHVSRELPFLETSMSEELFSLYFALLTLILALCFFAFTYALRKMAYTYALLGGLEAAPAKSPQAHIMGAQAAIVLTEAVRSMNAGIRGFYYAVAMLFLFVGPYVAMAATLVITCVLYYRQLYSPVARAIARYVEALRKISP